MQHSSTCICVNQALTRRDETFQRSLLSLWPEGIFLHGSNLHPHSLRDYQWSQLVCYSRHPPNAWPFLSNSIWLRAKNGEQNKIFVGNKFSRIVPVLVQKDPFLSSLSFPTFLGPFRKCSPSDSCHPPFSLERSPPGDP